jgi:hypothetical protein
MAAEASSSGAGAGRDLTRREEDDVQRRPDLSWTMDKTVLASGSPSSNPYLIKRE